MALVWSDVVFPVHVGGQHQVHNTRGSLKSTWDSVPILDKEYHIFGTNIQQMQHKKLPIETVQESSDLVSLWILPPIRDADAKSTQKIGA